MLFWASKCTFVRPRGQAHCIFAKKHQSFSYCIVHKFIKISLLKCKNVYYELHCSVDSTNPVCVRVHPQLMEVNLSLLHKIQQPEGLWLNWLQVRVEAVCLLFWATGIYSIFHKLLIRKKKEAGLLWIPECPSGWSMCLTEPTKDFNLGHHHISFLSD